MSCRFLYSWYGSRMLTNWPSVFALQGGVGEEQIFFAKAVLQKICGWMSNPGVILWGNHAGKQLKLCTVALHSAIMKHACTVNLGVLQTSILLPQTLIDTSGPVSHNVCRGGILEYFAGQSSPGAVLSRPILEWNCKVQIRAIVPLSTEQLLFLYKLHYRVALQHYPVVPSVFCPARFLFGTSS